MSEHAKWEPLFRFDDQSETFCYGFEMGILWRQFTAGDKIAEGTYHSQNVETIIRMAKHFGHSAAVKPCDTNGWITVTFTNLESEI